MIWYETQQSQCSWDHGDETGQSEPSGRDPRTGSERERERESVCVCVCGVYILIMSMEQTEICIKKKSRGVMQILERKDFV